MPDTKPTNPKDAIGSGKLPLELVPDTLRAFAALAFFEGASKYGRFNWRAAGVRSSIYRAALDRHLAKWWNGEDVDPSTGVPHLASVIACAGIILDADLCGKLTDDRPPPAPVGDLMDRLAANVAALKQQFEGHNPHQWTIADVQPTSPAVDRAAVRAGSVAGGDRCGLYRDLPRPGCEACED